MCVTRCASFYVCICFYLRTLCTVVLITIMSRNSKYSNRFKTNFGHSNPKLDINATNTSLNVSGRNFIAPPTTPKGPNPNKNRTHAPSFGTINRAEEGRALFRESLQGKHLRLEISSSAFSNNSNNNDNNNINNNNNSNNNNKKNNSLLPKSVSFYSENGDLKRKKLAARAEICKEILKTEETYVGALNQIIEEYYKPLQRECEKENSFITYDSVRRVFGNLETLKRIHSEHLLKILRRDANASSSVTENSFMIALAFLEMAPYLRGYAFYAGNHMQAVDEIIHLKKNKHFKKFIEAIEKKRSLRGALTLESLLIQPVQRIPRYKLLIQELLKHTSTYHDDYEPLQRCVALLADVTMDVNESIRRMENQRAVWKIQNYFPSEQIVEASRVYATEIPGCVIEIIERNKMKKHKNCTLFLFKDLLIFGEKHGKGAKAKYTLVFKAEIDDLTNAMKKDSKILVKRQSTFLCNIKSVAKPKTLDTVLKTIDELLKRLKTRGTRRSSFAMSLEKDKQEANLLSQVAKGTIALHTTSHNLGRHANKNDGDYHVGKMDRKKTMKKTFWSDDQMM